MRSLSALALVSALTSVAAADEACPLEHAVYTDGDLGYELKFRPAKPWELPGMTDAVYELTLPDGRELWGSVTSNMGTSRQVGALFFGCDRPGPDDGTMSEAQVAECQVWRNNVYGVVEGRAVGLPFSDQPAPPSLLFADLGRALRYSVLSGPGEEPWDQFDFQRCAE